MTTIEAAVFDLYGTLLQVGSVGRAAAGVTDDPAGLVALWRTKQLEYTWLRSLMGRHADFWAVTGDALDYTLDRLDITVDRAGRDRLLDAWLEPTPYPEVPAALEQISDGGRRRLAVLSNGTPSMLSTALAAGGLDKLIDPAISIEDAGIFKPHPSVYGLVEQTLGVPPGQVMFVSSNAWDAAGAAAFGFPVTWVNREDAPFERLGVSPQLIVSDLTGLAEELARLR
jgi:2-haloacid dehalogenase